MQEEPYYQNPHAELHSVTSGSHGVKKACRTEILTMVLKINQPSKDLNLVSHNAFFHARKYPEMVEIWSNSKVKTTFLTHAEVVS